MKTVVMDGRGRWMIGADLGLSQSYLFVGGQVAEVSDEDAAILLDARKTGDHVFVLADAPEAAPVLAEAEARAGMGGWSSPGKCCEDEGGDVVVDTVEDDAVTVAVAEGDPVVGTGEAPPKENDTALAGWGGVRVQMPPRNRPGGPAGRK